MVHRWTEEETPPGYGRGQKNGHDRQTTMKTRTNSMNHIASMFQFFDVSCREILPAYSHICLDCDCSYLCGTWDSVETGGRTLLLDNIEILVLWVELRSLHNAAWAAGS